MGIHAGLVNRPAALILQTAFVNAALTTVLAALAIAFFSGAGIEDRSVNVTIGVGIGASHESQKSESWRPIEFGKTVLWLCPFTAMGFGSFGWIAGIAGGGWMHLRTRRVHSRRRLTVETALIGALLGCLFPLFEVWTGQLGEVGDLRYQGLDLLLSPPCGCVCGYLCALWFRQRFMDCGGSRLRIPCTTGH